MSQPLERKSILKKAPAADLVEALTSGIKTGVDEEQAAANSSTMGPIETPETVVPEQSQDSAPEAEAAPLAPPVTPPPAPTSSEPSVERGSDLHEDAPVAKPVPELQVATEITPRHESPQPAQSFPEQGVEVPAENRTFGRVGRPPRKRRVLSFSTSIEVGLRDKLDDYCFVSGRTVVDVLDQALRRYLESPPPGDEGTD